MKTPMIIVLSLLVSSAVLANEGKEAKGADAQAIDQACSSDAQTAGCGDEKVGTGLLKCLHAYKKEHKKDFKFSDGCKAAMKKAHQDRKGKHHGGGDEHGGAEHAE